VKPFTENRHHTSAENLHISKIRFLFPVSFVITKSFTESVTESHFDGRAGYFQ